MDTTTQIGDWNKLGALVKDARTRRGWSQSELAAQAEVSRAWIAKLERGHRSAELEQILRIFRALQLHLLAQPYEAPVPLSEQPGMHEPTTRDARTAADLRRRNAWAHARNFNPSTGQVPRGQ